MKCKLSFVLFFLYHLITNAQITINSNNLVDVGDKIYQSYDDNVSLINLGQPALNQYWDFSFLQVNEIDTLNFVDPNTTSYSNLYNNVNICLEQNGSVSYFHKSIDGMYLHGISDTVFDLPALFYPLPLTYGLSVSDGPVLVIDEVITGQFLELALPSSTVSVLTNGLANKADTAVIKILNTSDFVVDGSGTISLPMGSFEALRMKSIKYTTSELDIYCSDTITGIGTWINNVPFSSIPFLSGSENNLVEYKYEWITNDSNVHFLLAEVYVDSLDNILDGISFQVENTISEIKNLSIDLLEVFPIPTTNQLRIKYKADNDVKYDILDNNGKLIKSGFFRNNIVVSFDDLALGVYFLKVTVDNNVFFKKLVKE